MPQPDNHFIKPALEAYPSIYEKVITEWQQDGPDALWLLYSANYIFRVGEVRWAVDPITLPARLSGTLPLRLQQDFSKLDFLILTHKHSDHLNWNFLKGLAALPSQWIVPEFLVEDCVEKTSVSQNQIIPAIINQWIEMKGVRILPMEGSHWEYAQAADGRKTLVKGLSSVCYLFEFHGRRWFFPGDVRSFDVTKIPHLGAFDGIVGHVWMGRMSSPLDEPPLFDQFCDYYSRFHTNHLILTHLYEVGRDLKDMWTVEHARRIIASILTLAPATTAEALCTGERLILGEVDPHL